MKKINDVKKKMKEFGIILSLAQLRKLERLGIVYCVHNPVNKYREFDDVQFDKTVTALLFYYFNTPLVEIRSEDKELLSKRAKLILKAARVVQRSLTK